MKLWLGLIILLTIYAPIELTRWIVVGVMVWYPQDRAQFVAEIAILWLFYISAMVLLGIKLLKR